jgi:hypothetical protein
MKKPLRTDRRGYHPKVLGCLGISLGEPHRQVLPPQSTQRLRACQAKGLKDMALLNLGAGLALGLAAAALGFYLGRLV